MTKRPTAKPKKPVQSASKRSASSGAPSKKAAAQKTAPNSKPDPKPGPQPGPQPAAKPAPAPAIQAVSRVGGPTGFLWALLAMAFVGGAVFATRATWLPELAKVIADQQPDPLADPRFAGVTTRLAALEQGEDFKKLEEQRQKLNQQVDALVKRLAGMESELKGLRGMVDASQPPKEATDAVQSLERLSGRLARLEQSRAEVDVLLRRMAESERTLPAKQGPKTAAEKGGEKIKSADAMPSAGDTSLIGAVSRLNKVLSGDGSFAKELAAVAALAGTDPDMKRQIAILEPFAAGGIPDLGQLRRRFTEQSTAIISAAHISAAMGDAPKAGDGGGFGGLWRKMRVKMESWVSVRRSDGTSGGPKSRNSAVLVDNAGTALAAGDLAAAVETVEGLSGAGAEAAAPWLKLARARLAADRAVAALHLFAISRLVPEKDSGKAGALKGAKQ